jgi:hypothetical protein
MLKTPCPRTPAITNLPQHMVLLILPHHTEAAGATSLFLLHNNAMPHLCSLLLLSCFICSRLLSEPLQLALGLRPVLPPVMLLMLLLLLLLIHIITRLRMLALVMLLPSLLPPLLLLPSLELVVLLTPLCTLLLLLLQVLHVLLVLLLVLGCITLIVTAASSRPLMLALLLLLLLLLLSCFCGCLVKRVLQHNINTHFSDKTRD